MKRIFGNTFSDIGDMFTTFTVGLDKIKNGDLKTWEDWGAAIGDIVTTSLAVATQVNDQYFEYKAASLEADKQRELTNAGDSAEERKKELIRSMHKKNWILKRNNRVQTQAKEMLLKLCRLVAVGYNKSF